MKRYNNQIGLIAAPDNLRLAFFKAQRSKLGKQEVQAYRADLHRNLALLREALLNETVSVGDYHYFKVFDPKERQICAAAFPERVLHHAIMNVCHAHFEQKQIYHSYATRPEKGTFKALAQAYRNSKRYPWFLKMDFRKYFDSISHPVLMEKLERLYKDQTLLRLFQKIVDSYAVSPGKGLPIGNLTSQYFANYFLAALDHRTNEAWGAPAYVRYMDDIVIWGQTKTILKDIGSRFEAVSGEIGLRLKPKMLNRSRNGLPFLGFRIYPESIRLAKRSKRRYQRKMKAYFGKLNVQEWDQSTFQRHVLPLTSFVAHADSLGFRNRVLNHLAGEVP